MRKSNPKTRNLLDKAIQLQQLPVLIPRAVAADFAVVSVRTLIRAERDGKLCPIRRGPQAVSYKREEFLRFSESEKAKLNENAPGQKAKKPRQ